MADEATVSAGLSIIKGNLQIQTLPQSFQADVSGTKGPTPGSFDASVDGTDVDLSELTTFGLCRIINYDDTNFIDVGIWDPETTKFYPLARLLAGEFSILRLSPDLQQEFAGTGTGTTGADTNRLRIKADTAACNVSVEAYEA